MSNLKAALYYREKLNYSVIPVGPNKKPLVEWKEYQEILPSPGEIREWWLKYPEANIGVVTGKVSNIVVVDIDSDDGMAAIQKYISILPTTVRSKTPKGKHLWFKWPGVTIPNNAGLFAGCDFRGDGGYVVAPPSKINGVIYFWEVSPMVHDPEILPPEYIKEATLFSGSYSPPRSTSGMFAEGRRDSDLFHTAMMLTRGRMPEAEIREVLSKLAASCSPPFPDDEVQIKVSSAMQRAKVREHGIKQSVTEWLEVAFGRFTVKDVANDLGLQAVEDRNKLSVTLSRMAEEGIIEKVLGQNAVYRKKDEKLEEIDFRNVKGDYIDLKWPFAIEDLILTMPKNVAVIAGESNAGKTAFMLNLVRMNMDKFPIHYFSSEMGDIEFNTRLKKFGIPMSSWNFHAYERAEGFHDVIVPDALNIVDFLEIYDEFYKVGWFIKKIYDALTTGVAVIALQKNPKTDLGLGGMRGIEKARLYLAMEANRVKVVKAKNWKTDMNPNGLIKMYKLVNGCDIRDCTNWERENKGGY